MSNMYYDGTRPVLKGRFSQNNVHPWTGEVGEYSNFSIFNIDNVLDGAPRVALAPRTPDDPFKALDDAGSRNEFHWAWWDDDELTDELQQPVFRAGFGHAIGESPYGSDEVYEWNGFEYFGITPEPLSGDFGHGLSYYDSVTNPEGFDNLLNRQVYRVGDDPLEDPGHTLDDDPYQVRGTAVWQGVQSSNALNV